ncbi:hypothetical protein AVEN_262731-1 [Araneus ventricosus]|uniref:Uncharacterized protein n=1 Tax=Araneus ventricosus TaxID=182803 RepID=A0A4Y2N014_ARAVE|nr:hypothetical protein AVEN_262731-1 [Araneus ventricosus]
MQVFRSINTQRRPVPDAITATEPVGWTWDDPQNVIARNKQFPSPTIVERYVSSNEASATTQSPERCGQFIEGPG